MSEGPTFNTGNAAADKLLTLMGEEFDAAMPWFTEDGGVKFISLTLLDGDDPQSVTVAFVDAGDPEFILNDMTFRGVQE